MGGWRIGAAERGSATVEFVGLLPALLLAVLIAAQFLLAGFSLWSASIAARAGARAVHIGADPQRAAKRAVPEPMRAGTRVSRRGPVIASQVPVPRLLPILPVVRVQARSALEAAP